MFDLPEAEAESVAGYNVEYAILNSSLLAEANVPGSWGRPVHFPFGGPIIASESFVPRNYYFTQVYL
ncbi:hypothetical protein LXL04_020833 [Taraxacum kok-saghyz]